MSQQQKKITKPKNHLETDELSKSRAKSKRVLILLIVGSLILFTIYFLIYWNASKSITVTSSKSLMQMTENNAGTISSVLQSDSAKLKEYGNQFVASNDTNYSGILKEINNSDRLDHYYSSISFLTVDGNIYTKDSVKKNQNKELNKMLNKEHPQHFITNKNSLYCIEQVYKDNTLKGIIIGKYNKTQIKHINLNDISGKEHNSFIVDSKGNVIFNVSNMSDSKYNIKFNNILDEINKSSSNKKLAPKIKRDFKKGKKNYGVYVFNSQPFVVTYSPINNIYDWYQVTLTPKSIALSEINYLIFVSILIGAFIILCLGIIIYSYIKANVAHSENLHNLAFNDPLTGYRNFLKFKIDAESILNNTKNQQYSLCYIDLVGFKFVNEAFGYEAGDQLLKDIAKILDEILKENEIFARISGDRFIVLRHSEKDKSSANDTLYTFVDKIGKIPPLISSRMKLEVHVGVYVIDQNSDLNINAMFDRSIIALETIAHSDSSLAYYDDVLRIEQLEKKDIEQRMEAALNDGEFQVYIQPKYRTSNRTLAAGEALIRWIDPEKGVVPPIKFIPIFEKNRFIFNLDRYVLEVVCRFLRRRIDEGKEVVPISLNVSPVEILMPHFTQSYISIKDKYNIPDKIIELEFTEGIFFENQELFKKVIIELKEAGFCCSLDDFGSGFSSLNVLKEMPVDILKLDRLFFRESGDIVRDRSIIRSVVAMARSLHIKTVAEGVETLDTVEFLKLIGCNMIQGYIYARPMPLKEFESLMNSEKINENGDFSDDYDKVSDIVPVDKPYDIPIRDTYEVIFEINTTADTYHMYKKDDCTLDLDNVAEIGEYSKLYKDGSKLKIHPDYINDLKNIFNVAYIENYFKDKQELRYEYKTLDKSGKYIWSRIRVLKAKSDEKQTVYFIYVKNINDTKSDESNTVVPIAETRVYSAFIGIVGILLELNLETNEVDLVKNFSNHVKSIFITKQYNKLTEHITNNLMHKSNREKFLEECSVDNLRQYFTDSPSKAICYEYYARPSVKTEDYRWYTVRFSYNPELSNKVIIAIQDITTEKHNKEYWHIRQKLMEKAIKHSYDKILEINLNKNRYFLTTITNKDEGKEVTSEGEYKEFYEKILRNSFLSSDNELVREVLSSKGLWDMYNDKSVSDFTLNIKKKDYKGEYEWYSLYIIPNTKSIDKTDAIVFIFMKNIQLEKNLQDRVILSTNRLNSTTSLFELAFDVNFNNDNCTIFGGKNIPVDLLTEKTISYKELCGVLKKTYVAKDDYEYFTRSMSVKNLANELKNNNQLSIFVRSHFENTKWLDIKFLYDNRSKTACVFILDKKDNNN